MNRPVAIALAIALGLPTGYFGRGALEPPVDRVASAMALFRTYCVPFIDNETVPISDQLISLPRMGEAKEWGQTGSHLMLKLDEGRCVVSDMLEYFGATDRAVFAAEVRDFVKQNFPMLEAEDSALSGSWDLSEMWMQYDQNDPRRWGITLNRFQAEGPEASTFITAYARKE